MLDALNGHDERDWLECGRALVLKRRPDAVIKLTPIYQDAFSGGGAVFKANGFDPAAR